jgi:hypothetical protein
MSFLSSSLTSCPTSMPRRKLPLSHNGLLHARPALARKLAPTGHARNPRYVLRPLRACSVASWVQLATLEYQSSCGHGFAVTASIEVRRYALSVERTPAHPASQPRRGRAAGASLLARHVCQASRPPPPGGGSLNSRRPTAERGLPCGASRRSRLAPQGTAS